MADDISISLEYGVRTLNTVDDKAVRLYEKPDQVRCIAITANHFVTPLEARYIAGRLYELADRAEQRDKGPKAKSKDA